MPSIVKTNATLSAGGLQLVNYSVEQQADATLAVDAEFLCLPEFQSQILKSLRTNAPAPKILMANSEFVAILQSLGSISTPLIQSCRAQSNYGLTSISIVLGIVTSVSRAGEAASVTREVTTSTDLRSFSGSVSDNEGTAYAINFDYYAQTVTVEGGEQGLALSEQAYISPPFNVRSGVSNVEAYLNTFTSQTSRTYRNNVGVMKTQTTYSISYIQSRFALL